MILSAQSIRARCQGFLRPELEPMIWPFSERAVHEESGMSYGLSSCGYDVTIDNLYILEPGMFVLAATLEKFHMPHSVCAVVHDKSSWARRGLCVQNTVFEPGWFGYATLELTNHGKEIIYLSKGMPIAQVMFHMLDARTDQPYKGKYQNQESGPQEARVERPDGSGSTTAGTSATTTGN